MFFGTIMLISVLRFVSNGWIETQYLEPVFHFPYYGFEWIKPLGSMGIYGLFALMVLAATGIIIGFQYRLSALFFFLAFTYVELIDKTNYLNHYYFVSIIAFVLIAVPAHRNFSVDALLSPGKTVQRVSYGYVLIIRLLLSLVYFYAGLAKLNSDWMLEALPLKIWLPPHTGLPLIGPLMDETWVAYAFSWFGAIYDLSIPFLLFYRKTRPYAFGAVVLFHLSTWLLFPIGMFPFIMILATTIFFSQETHERVLSTLKGVLKIRKKTTQLATTYQAKNQWLIWILFAALFIFQAVFPWRFLAYPGKLFWTEQGYRFSWRVMLMEKAGYAIFHVRDPASGKEWEAYANDYLTPMQEKQMATQPDMILQFVHFLEKQLQDQGITDPEIRAEVYVSLNGRGSRLFIDPEVDLTDKKDSFKHKDWILPYTDR
ncbi:HTTM domain-containing protein [Echinicola soli]|uniref:HTTM domain-containing protein n=2 Tax=Echinicola soli TaxID=2591634 RepID=A0A514CP69_9BACT|nr:HTTM domain-containing protein [Echinicola soli]